MIEKLARNCWGSLRVPLLKLAAQMQSIRAGIWIILIVMLLLVVRIGGTLFNREAGHRDEIATSVGSIGFFYGTPKPDNSGRNILYFRTSEKGVGLFIHNLASGDIRLLNEFVDDRGFTCDVCPFSPDEKFFAYRYNGVNSVRYLAICDTDSGRDLIRMDTTPMMETDTSEEWIATEGAWLTAQRFSWIKMKIVSNHEPRVCQIHFTEEQTNGTWKDWNPNIEFTNASCLSPLSDDTVAWLDDGGIHTFNVLSRNVTGLAEPNGKRIIGISYCKNTAQFLITCRERGGYSLWSLKTDTNALANYKQLTSDNDIERAQWLNGGLGYAYLNQSTLVVDGNAADISAARLKQADVDDFSVTPDGQHLFILGVVGNDLGVGLWRYDVSTDSLTNVVPATDYQSQYTVRMDPIHCVTRVGRNQVLNYYVYFPAHFNRHKKYPILIGNTFFRTTVYQGGNHGFSWAEAIAACGAYVVIVDRKDWILIDPKEWGRDIMSVYSQLATDPTIDTRKAYIYAVSAETLYLTDFLKGKPGLWKGALLLNPGELPDLSNLAPNESFPEVLINAGAEERESERFRKYQEDACGRGVKVEVEQAANAGHVFVSVPAVRERIRAMEKFVFDN